MDDHIIGSVHVELYLAAGIAVGNSDLRLFEFASFEGRDKASEMGANSAGDFCDSIIADALDLLQVWIV